jgi:ribosome production factor 2
MGPNMDLSLRRSTLAGDDMWKAALKTPVTATVKKTKNISRTSMGDKVGRIHMKKQDLNNMGVRRMTVLRSTTGSKKRREREEEAGPAITEDAPEPVKSRPRHAKPGAKRARMR